MKIEYQTLRTQVKQGILGGLAGILMTVGAYAGDGNTFWQLMKQGSIDNLRDAKNSQQTEEAIRHYNMCDFWGSAADTSEESDNRKKAEEKAAREHQELLNAINNNQRNNSANQIQENTSPTTETPNPLKYEIGDGLKYGTGNNARNNSQEKTWENSPKLFACTSYEDLNNDGLADRNEYLGENDVFDQNQKITIVAAPQKTPMGYLFLNQNGNALFENWNIPSGNVVSYTIKPNTLKPENYFAERYSNREFVEKIKITVLERKVQESSNELSQTNEPLDEKADIPLYADFLSAYDEIISIDRSQDRNSAILKNNDSGIYRVCKKIVFDSKINDNDEIVEKMKDATLYRNESQGYYLVPK